MVVHLEHPKIRKASFSPKPIGFLESRKRHKNRTIRHTLSFLTMCGLGGVCPSVQELQARNSAWACKHRSKALCIHAGRASPIMYVQVIVWPSPVSSSACLHCTTASLLISFLQRFCLVCSKPSRTPRYYPTMSEAAAADADTTKVNLVSFSSAVSDLFLCGVFPLVRLGESDVTSAPKSREQNLVL